MKPWLVAALVALCAVVLWQRAEVRRAHDGRVAAEAERRLARREADSLRAVVAERVDTFTVERERWRTVTRTNTLYRVSRETLVVRGERAITACERALSACQAQVATLERVDTAGVRALELSKREARGCRVLGLLPCPTVTAGWGATLGADGRVTHGPGVLVGVRLW